MKIQIKEALFRASLLGGLFNSLIYPSYGMEKEEGADKPIEMSVRRIKHHKTTKPSKSDIESLHKDFTSLTTQSIDQWIAHAGTGDLVSLYHLGWLVDQKEKNKTPIFKKDQSDTLILKTSKFFYWSMRAQNQDDTQAWSELGILYFYGQGVEKDYVEALKWCLKAAQQNNAVAQNAVGVIYDTGLGVDKDYAKAMKWFLKSAEQNEPCALYNLGLMHEHGRGLKRDYAEAIEWYLKAAMQGHVYAKERIPLLYKNQKRVDNYNLVIDLFHKAIRQSDSDAQYELGERSRSIESFGLFERSNKLRWNKYKEAMEWYLMAAEQNHVTAQYNVGLLHEHGLGAEKNYTEAMKWYLEAAKNGHREALVNLFSMHLNGFKAPKNQNELIKWLTNFANEGHAKSQFILGMTYIFEENEREGKEWLEKAVTNGCADAQQNLKVIFGNVSEQIDNDISEKTFSRPAAKAKETLLTPSETQNSTDEYVVPLLLNPVIQNEKELPEVAHPQHEELSNIGAFDNPSKKQEREDTKKDFHSNSNISSNTEEMKNSDNIGNNSQKMIVQEKNNNK